MIQLLLNVVSWFRKPNGFKAIQSDVRHGFRLLVDSTLLNPQDPNGTCSPEYLKILREAAGFEPATRTLVRSCTAGHTVQVLLLKNGGRSDATGVRN